MTREEEEVLAANQAFYDAFRARDLKQMDRLWAHASEVAVVHPGWPAIHGRNPVMESWRGIIEGPAPPDIRCDEPRVYVLGAAAFVICTEHLPQGDLVATNLFANENGQWKLVHHHAGAAPPPEPLEPGSTVH